MCGLDLWEWQDKGRTWSGVNLLPFRTNRYIFSVVCSLQGTHITSYIREYTNLRYATIKKMKIKAKLIVRNDTFIHLWFYHSTFLFAKSFFEMIASKTRDKSVMVMQFALTPRLAVCRPLGVPSFYTCISACPFLWGTLWSCCVCSCSRHGFCSLGLEVPPRWQNHGGSLEALVPVSLSLLF